MNHMTDVNRSEVELTTAHKKMTLRVGTDKFALLANQFGAADGTVIPPIFFSLRFDRACVRSFLQVRLQDR